MEHLSTTAEKRYDFTLDELARLSIYRAAVQGGFFTDFYDGQIQTNAVFDLRYLRTGIES